MEQQSNYFQGILQLREPTDRVKKFIEDYCDKNQLISRTAKVKNGFDYYFLSQKKLRNFGNILKRKFSGKLKVTNTLHTRNSLTSRDLYRYTILFKCCELKVGDCVKYKGEDSIITRLDKKINIKRKSDDKKFCVRFQELI